MLRDVLHTVTMLQGFIYMLRDVTYVIKLQGSMQGEATDLVSVPTMVAVRPKD